MTMLGRSVGVPAKRRKLGSWLRVAAAVWASLVGAWFAVITWPESGGVYVWLAAPLGLCLLSLAAAQRDASKVEGWLYVAALGVVAVLSLASFGMFLIPALVALIVAQSLPVAGRPSAEHGP